LLSLILKNNYVIVARIFLKDIKVFKRQKVLDVKTVAKMQLFFF